MIQSNQSFLSRDIIFSLSHDIHVVFELSNYVKICSNTHILLTRHFEKSSNEQTSARFRLHADEASKENLPKIVKTGVVMMGCRVLNYACSLVQFVETASFAAKQGFKRINLATPLILPFHSLIARA